MATPTTRQELIDYCLRQLGHPVVEVNLDVDQIEDRVDDALQFYQEYHMDSVDRMYFKHQITSSDITNKYIAVPDSLLYVNRVLPMRGVGSGSSIFSLDYQMHLNGLASFHSREGDVVSYEMSKQYIALVDRTINGMSEAVSFSRHKNQLAIHVDWDETFEAGQYLIVEGYSVIDPETYTEVYNDSFLKEYLTALLKRQWGRNLSKFEGMQLPGGITLNGRQILDEAIEEIRLIKEQMNDNYGTPLGVFVG